MKKVHHHVPCKSISQNAIARILLHCFICFPLNHWMVREILQEGPIFDGKKNKKTLFPVEIFPRKPIH